jgi:ABC-type transport system substrate-binding protein
MKAQLAQVGIRMEVTTMEWGAFSDFIALPVEQNQAVAYWYGWRSVNGDVDSAISDMHSRFFRPKGNNGSFYKNDAYDRLVDQEQSEPDPVKRADQLRQMQQMLMDDLPFLPLYNEPQIWAAKKSLQGVTINPLTCIQPLHLATFGS